MKRRLFTSLSAVSLLLSATIIVMWVRCYWVRDTFKWLRQVHEDYTFVHWEVDFAKPGLVSIERWWQTFNVPTGLGTDYQRLAGFPVHEAREDYGSDFPPRSGRSYQFLGFCFDWTLDGSFFGTTGSGEVFVSVPFWFLLGTTGVLPFIWTRERLRRNKCGRCRVCGYDLRATPDRCPECGTPAKVEA